MPSSCKGRRMREFKAIFSYPGGDRLDETLPISFIPPKMTSPIKLALDTLDHVYKCDANKKTAQLFVHIE